MARGLGVGALLLIVVVLALFLAPGSPLRVDSGEPASPEVELTSLTEGTCVDAPGTTADDNCATGNAEIAIRFDERSVVLSVTATASANTLSPDSFAIDFGLRCAAACTRVEGEALTETTYAARIVGLGAWTIAGNTSTVDLVETGAGIDDPGPLVGWTSSTEGGGTTFWGQEDGGALARLEDGETATISLTIVLNEELPTTIPTGQVYTREATVEIYSPVGGTSLSVTLTLTLTANN